MTYQYIAKQAYQPRKDILLRRVVPRLIGIDDIDTILIVENYAGRPSLRWSELSRLEK